MKLKALVCLFSLLIFFDDSFGLNLNPDSLAKDISPMSHYSLPLGTITIKNESDQKVIVDSVNIRFLNGDSMDFKMGIDCQPDEFYDYNYRGWVYGITYMSLRHVQDSLFTLQDSLGDRVSFSINAHDSSQFVLYLIVNCPMCGRMPSFPSTTNFLYLFHSTGHSDSLIINVQDQTSIRLIKTATSPMGNLKLQKRRFNIAGQALRENNHIAKGIIIDERSRMIWINDKDRAR